MRLDHIDIVAADFDGTLDFYRRLGLAIPPGPTGDDGIRHTEVAFDNGVQLQFDNDYLAEFYNAGWRKEPRARVVLGFHVDTREEVDVRYHDLVAAGYEGRQPPFDAFWGARYAIVADPTGIDVGFMSPIDDARKSWPPEHSPDISSE
jgi:uncharacterized glyoxalase superfamily protein PhnB